MKIRYLAIFLSLIAAIAFILPEVASARKSDHTIYLKEGKHSRDLENDLQIGAPSEKTDSLEISTATNMPININCHEATELYIQVRHQASNLIRKLVDVEKLGVLLQLKHDHSPTGEVASPYSNLLGDIRKKIMKIEQSYGKAPLLPTIPLIIDNTKGKLPAAYLKFGRAVQAVCDKCDATPKVMKDDGFFCHVLGIEPPIEE